VAFVITTLVLFAFTLLVPGLASATEEENIRRRIARLQGSITALQQEQAALEASNAPLRERIQIERELAIANKEQAIAAEELITVTQKGTVAAKDAAVKLKQLEKQLEKTKEGFNKGSQAAKGFVDDLAGVLGVSNDLGSSIMGSFVDASRSGETFASTMRNVRAAMQDTFNFTNVGVSIFRKLVEATVAVATAHDKAISSFIRATGASQDYGRVMESVFMSSRQIGVSMEEAGQAVQSLYTSMAAFSTLNSTVRIQLTQQVALMNEIGISTDSAARAFDTLTKVMHRTPMEAARISQEMVNMAERIGVPPARLIQEFSQASSQLAKYGDQMTRVFMELQGAAKATGIALGDLVGIASQFDTFYGAAEAAGRLNSILGGPYLNSIALLNANEQERIRLLIQSVQLSGRSFETMNRFERQAVAAAAGINDMAQASRIFGQSLDEYDRAQRAAERGAAAQRDLAARAAEAQTVFEMMANIGYSFAIAMRPVVEVLRDVMQAVAEVSAAISGSALGRNVLAATVGILAFKGVILALGAALGALMSPMTAVAGVLGSIAYIFTRSNSPTFPEYVGLAANNMGNLARSAREALPSVKALNREMAMTAASMTATATAATNAKVRATAGGLSVVRVEESAELKGMFRQLIRSNDHYVSRLEGIASKDTVLKINNREFGRATRNVFNREMGRAGSA